MMWILHGVYAMDTRSTQAMYYVIMSGLSLPICYSDRYDKSYKHLYCLESLKSYLVIHSDLKNVN